MTKTTTIKPKLQRPTPSTLEQWEHFPTIHDPIAQMRLARAMGYPPSWRVIRNIIKVPIPPHIATKLPKSSIVSRDDNGTKGSVNDNGTNGGVYMMNTVQDRIYAGPPQTRPDGYYNHASALLASSQLPWRPEFDDVIHDNNDDDYKDEDYCSTSHRNKGGQLKGREARFEEGDLVQVLYDEDEELEPEWFEATVLKKIEYQDDIRLVGYYIIMTLYILLLVAMFNMDSQSCVCVCVQSLYVLCMWFEIISSKSRYNVHYTVDDAIQSNVREDKIRPSKKKPKKPKAPPKPKAKVATAAAAATKKSPAKKKKKSPGRPKKRPAEEEEETATTPKSKKKKGRPAGSKNKKKKPMEEEQEDDDDVVVNDYTLDEGDPPWRTTGHEHLSRKLQWTPHADEVNPTPQPCVGTVVAWIAETDVDSEGNPGFEDSRTGQPANLFHVVFDEFEQDFEEWELEECFV